MVQYTCIYPENTEMTQKKYIERIYSFHSKYISL